MRVNDSTPGDPTLEYGEPTPEESEATSFAETTKNWYRKHRGKVLAAGGVLGGMALFVVVASLVGRQDGERYDAERYDAEDIGDSEPVSGDEAADEPRQSSLDPDRDPFLRRLPAGQQASEAAKARYKELTGKELPPGYTLVRRWFFLSPDDEDPGEAAA
ncbi:hypothetical protein [Streptomyces sp. NPDC001811]